MKLVRNLVLVASALSLSTGVAMAKGGKKHADKCKAGETYNKKTKACEAKPADHAGATTTEPAAATGHETAPAAPAGETAPAAEGAAHQ